MLTLETTVEVKGITGMEIFDFLVDPDDDSYRAWWPGTHLEFHSLKRGRSHVGDVVYMDEYVGRRRLRLSAIVTDAEPGKKLAWQLRKGVKLPARLSLRLDDRDGGVTITHTTRAGFRGPGRLLDPLLRALMTSGFARDLNEHVLREFPRLRDLLVARRAGVSTLP